MPCAAAAILVKPQAAIVLAVLPPVLACRHLVDRRDPSTLVRAAGATVGLLAVCLPSDLEHFASPRTAAWPVLTSLPWLRRTAPPAVG